MLHGRKQLRAAALAMVALLAGAAAADTIVLKDGNRYDGRAERRGDKVRIHMDYGTIEVPADDVDHIIPSAPASRPSTAPGPPEAPAAGGALDTSQFTMADVTRPEPLAFLFMRNLPSTTDAGESYNLRRQIRHFRILAHERQRKVGGQWLTPEVFQRRRRAFADYLRQARELEDDADRVRGDDPADEAERLRLRRQAAGKYRAAAQQWADPLLRRFLLGIAELYAGNPRRAEPLFRACAEEAPQVAGFHQGRALALRELRQYDDALEAALTALRLRPEAPQAVALVADTMAEMPGAQTQRPPYTTAAEILERYSDVEETVERARDDLRWLMPGLRRRWGVRDEGAMPDLPYDRFDFRQAVGVPVGEQFLLVDETAVEDAEEVFVRLPDGTLLPAEAARMRSGMFGSRGPLPPLRVLSVPGATFTPLEVVEEPPAGVELTARAVGIYREMGSQPRTFTTQLEQQDDGWTPTVPLAAGEGAAPLLAPDGKLAGLLAGRTDVAEEGGGPDRLLPPGQIQNVLENTRMRIRSGGYSFGHRRAERTVEPRGVEGRTFLILATFGETFE
jgi:tetratricopeptide (TPR) repeat protein